MFVAAEVNDNLAQISNVLMYSAMAVYTLSFLAHCMEWVFGSRSRVAVQSAALAAASRASEAAEAAKASAVSVTVATRAGAP